MYLDSLEEPSGLDGVLFPMQGAAGCALGDLRGVQGDRVEMGLGERDAPERQACYLRVQLSTWCTWRGPTASPVWPQPPRAKQGRDLRRQVCLLPMSQSPRPLLASMPLGP